jgi:CheY-like chemotaxis protein
MTTVLIVEDERPLNEAYQTILQKHGYETQSAGNGEEALALVGTKVPDVILLDMKMPKMNGLEFLRQLEVLKPAPQPVVIIFSNLDTQTDIDEAFRLGAKHYMLKSWAAPQELVRVVEAALK